MMTKTVAPELIRRLGGSYARELGIRLAADQEAEVFKWFLASFLFGARIGQSLAARTYKEFEKHNVLTPDRILQTGWDGLVKILDAGGYVRYDFSTATKLLQVAKDLCERYGGGINHVHALAEGPADLEERLQGVGKGVGPVTANIFLRELRGIWPKAQPLPCDAVVLAARNLGLLGRGKHSRRETLDILKRRWSGLALRGVSFVDFEAAMVRLGLAYCRKDKHSSCPVASWCSLGERSKRAS